MTRFDASKRERLLSVLREGQSVTEAAASVGVSTTTIAKWAACGRAPDADAEHREFATAYDAIRQGQSNGHPTTDDDSPLTEDGVRRLLESSSSRPCRAVEVWAAGD
jgi:transposase-like protein